MELPIKPGERPADFRLCTMGGTSKALRDFRGRKTLVFAWAPWCGCRDFLVPLQRFHRKHPGVHVVTVALDAQGVDMPLKYLTQARADFEMLLDASCLLSRKWGLKRPGLLVLLDENGTAMFAADPPEEKDLEKVEKRLADKPVSPVPPEAKVDHRDVKVELLVQACTNFLTRKKVQEAVESLRKALAADPGNLIIARQVLVLQHPEKFYPAIDREWVKSQPPVAPL